MSEYLHEHWSLPDDERLAGMVTVLKSVSGGPELLAWFSGHPNFHDAEILRLDLNRRGASLAMSQSFSAKGHYGGAPFKHAIITFCFSSDDVVEVSMHGFSHQNVIGSMWLRAAQDAEPHVSFIGTGLGRGDVEFEFEPCFGPFGTLRATIEKITITPVDDYQKADEPSSMTK